MSDAIRSVGAALTELTLFRGVTGDAVGEAVRQWLGEIEGAEGLGAAYSRIFAALAEAGVAPAASPPSGASRANAVHRPARDAWAAHWIGRVLTADNPFSVCAARRGAAGVPDALMEAARHDLETLRRFSIDGGAHVRRRTEEALVERSAVDRDAADRDAEAAAESDGDRLPARLPDWAGLPVDPVPPGTVHPDAFRRMVEQMVAALDEPDGWGKLAPELADFYREVGAGKVARFGAFRWESGRMRGIAAPDPVGLSDLIGYERERAQVIDNTAQFARGLPANNVLLYGERGTGKSATVKALLREFGREGLRLVELPKSGIGETTHIFRTLAGHPQRFILFIDDLSFEGEEVAYKELKAVLEGGLERQPDNVRIYATSNRRHLVQERMRERPKGPYGVSPEPGEDEEVRGWDVVQERLSLADRFGLTVVFQAPEQDLYLEIVEGLAKRRGIALPGEALRAEALRWTLQQNGRSARTAHQFVDYLAGRAGVR